VRAAPAYPVLAPGERAIAETPLGGATAVLTDRRLVVTGRDFEQSLPLAHVALVRVRFERTGRAVAYGVALLVAAAVLFAVASPLRALLLNQSVSLEQAAAEERGANAQTGAGGGIASGLQRILGGLAAIVGLFPVAGWLLLLGGAAKIALGVVGRTVVTVAAGGAEVEFAKRGNSRPLHEFAAEVGRQLPGPRR
jgi:hypothetical protein